MQICSMPLALSLSASLAYLIIAITASLHQLLEIYEACDLDSVHHWL